MMQVAHRAADSFHGDHAEGGKAVPCMNGSDGADQEWRLLTRALLAEWEATLLVTRMVLAAHRAMAAAIARSEPVKEQGGAGGDDGGQG